MTHTTVQIDNAQVRVTRYDLGPGDSIPWHRHEHDYVVVPITDGKFEVVTSDGRAAQSTTAGEPYERTAGAEHELVNGTEPYSFVEVELLQLP